MLAAERANRALARATRAGKTPPKLSAAQKERLAWEAKDPERQAKWAPMYGRAKARGDKAEMRRLVDLGYRPPTEEA
jgi:hypothetical protein